VAASKPRSSLGPQAPRTLVAPERTGPRLSRPAPKRKLSAKQRELRAFFEQGGHTRHLPPQVRRHATNLWERSHLALEEADSEEDRALAASAWNPMVGASRGGREGRREGGRKGKEERKVMSC